MHAQVSTCNIVRHFSVKESMLDLLNNKCITRVSGGCKDGQLVTHSGKQARHADSPGTSHTVQPPSGSARLSIYSDACKHSRAASYCQHMAFCERHGSRMARSARH